jgi:hypothetical protein
MIKKMGLEERSGQQGTATSENSEMTWEMAKASTPTLTGPFIKVYSWTMSSNQLKILIKPF